MYITIELQSTPTSIAHLETVTDTLPQAEQVYHTILSAAAVSEVPIHSAVLMDSSGYVLKQDTYVHSQEEEENAD